MSYTIMHHMCMSTIIFLSVFDVPISGILVSDKGNNPKTVMGHKVYGIEGSELNLDSALIYISTEIYYREIC